MSISMGDIFLLAWKEMIWYINFKKSEKAIVDAVSQLPILM